MDSNRKRKYNHYDDYVKELQGKSIISTINKVCEMIQLYYIYYF